jgi:hypothetical protein
MKWTYLSENRIGEQREITKFLILPCGINGEMKWLCKSKILQKIVEGGAHGVHLYWKNIKFLN